MRTFTLTIVLLGVVSIVQMWPTQSQQWVGVITGIEPGEWIRVANDQSDPWGIEIALDSRTRSDADPRTLRRGTRVSVLYVRSGGPAIARSVSILPDDPPRPLRKPQKDLRQ